MSLTIDDVEKIAHLARLDMQPNDAASLQQDLSNILNLVEQMNAVDTQNVQPMAHPLSMSQRLREDAATEQNQRDDYQAISPAVEKGLFLVPKVIE
jgi:aspartyl-tRNA(Asn)/glutamyl-tRNA(Gln) amidotransferase subunit C